MSHAVAMVILVLVVLAALGGALDFLLSQEAHEKVNERLKRWYHAVSSDGWHYLVASSAHVSDALLGKLFGRRALSWKYGIFAFIVNLVVATFVMSGGNTNEARLLLQWISFPLAWALTNATIDVTSLGACRLVLRRISRDRSRGAIVTALGLLFAVTYLAIGSAWSLATMLVVWASSVLLPGNQGLTVPFASRLLLGIVTWPADLSAILHPAVDAGRLLMILLAGLSGLFFLLILAASSLVVIMRPLLQGPLAIIIDRLAKAPAGSIATASAGIAVFGGLIAALKDALAK